MINVLVTGGHGQLANNIKDISNFYNDISFTYKDSHELDITKLKSIEKVFEELEVDYCINCAAYTAVDKSEEDNKTAFNVNENGARNLAKICSKNNTVLIHISTDFVFSGDTPKAYVETSNTNPLGVYGLSKLKGEIAIKENLNQYYIIRTSWLYSEYNSNFMKTMINLSESRDRLNVVDDQIGTPTYAKDLAEIILKIITSKNENFGIYHYSNEGVASWYDFAVAVFSEIRREVEVAPIKTEDYPALANRPKFSVLDKSKIKKSLQIKIPHWRQSLSQAIINYKNLNTKA